MGGIAGFISLIIHLINISINFATYKKDKAKVNVFLIWDYKTERQAKNILKYAMVKIANNGRRPIYIENVYLEYPDEICHVGLLTTDGTYPIGQKLLEEDAPMEIYVFQDTTLSKYKDNWQKIKAVAIDSQGNRYISKKIEYTPNWVKKLTHIENETFNRQRSFD